jgi:mono/diheme cytochrome c family protein
MRQIRIGRRTGIGLAIVASAVALGTPVALAHTTAQAQNSPPASASITNGYQIFNNYFCVACHTMKAAGPAAYGKLGMNFNRIHAPYVVAVATVTNGLPAALPLYPTQMVGFGKVLTTSQIQSVAAFVSTYSGGYKTCAPCAGVTVTGFPTGSSSSS